jgi:hypothetical protein
MAVRTLGTAERRKLLRAALDHIACGIKRGDRVDLSVETDEVFQDIDAQGFAVYAPGATTYTFTVTPSHDGDE